jgi:hypothetical protein
MAMRRVADGIGYAAARRWNVSAQPLRVSWWIKRWRKSINNACQDATVFPSRIPTIMITCFLDGTNWSQVPIIYDPLDLNQLRVKR